MINIIDSIAEQENKMIDNNNFGLQKKSFMDYLTPTFFQGLKSILSIPVRTTVHIETNEEEFKWLVENGYLGLDNNGKVKPLVSKQKIIDLVQKDFDQWEAD